MPMTAEGLIFRCHRGKNRRSGTAAPPFEWACPHSSLLTPAHQDRCTALLQQVVPAGLELLVPTLQPHRCSLHEASGFGSSPCRDSGWRAILRACVALNPTHWPPRHPGQPCARSTRALATLAEVLGLSHSERLLIGSWVDPMDVDGKRLSRMPSTYVACETRLWSQFSSKRRITNVVGDLLACLGPAEVGARPGTDLWQTLCGPPTTQKSRWPRSHVCRVHPWRRWQPHRTSRATPR